MSAEPGIESTNATRAFYANCYRPTTVAGNLAGAHARMGEDLRRFEVRAAVGSGPVVGASGRSTWTVESIDFHADNRK